jgi:hypothetical protein
MIKKKNIALKKAKVENLLGVINGYEHPLMACGG